ncbi:hypothetical protein IKG31_03260 [Candidatus Saccharibacteria bacterium]|nr:hypothetical protein [Candidatus Saccharibacteria bacterium]
MIELLVVVGVSTICVAVYKKLTRKTIENWEVPEEYLARQMPDEFPAYKKLFEMQARSAYFAPFRHN